MIRIITAMAVTLALATNASGCAASTQSASPDRVSFEGSKGVNLHSWLTWTAQTSPSTYKIPVFKNTSGRLDEQEIAALKSAGFSFVRLTVDPGVFVLLTGTQRDDAAQTLMNVVDKLRSERLSVIVDMHPVRAVFPFGAAQGGGQHAYQKGVQSPFSERYAAAVAWIGARLDARYATTRQVALELMNEPDVACGDPLWTGQLVGLHNAVRAAAPKLALVLNGACWDDIDGLIALDPSTIKDQNVLYTFHFYDGHDFTHGGMKGSASEDDQVLASLGSLPYPASSMPQTEVLRQISANLANANPDVKTKAMVRAERYLAAGWNRERIDSRMDKVASWAAKYGIAASRILMGEFGVNGRRGGVAGQPQADRLRWLADTRQSAEQHGFRWALWQYRGNGFNDDFDLELSRDGKLDPQMLSALGLR
jgi:endoglucanase